MRINKRFLIAFLFIMMIFNSSASYSEGNYSEITGDKKIIQVLDSFNKTSMDKKTLEAIMGSNLSKKPVKIMFADLMQFSAHNEDYDALTCMDSSERLYILIDNKHKDAPVEALMSILSHEVIHQDKVSSKAEELQGWLNEVLEWIALKKLNPELENIPENKYPLVDRLNTIEKMYINAGYSSKEIYTQICSNPVYTDLPLYSPGFNNIVDDTYISSIMLSNNTLISHSFEAKKE